MGGSTFSRRTTELLLLIAGSVPVVLIYAMYCVTKNVDLSVSTLAVPIGLFAAFSVAHVAIRFLAPAADPVILPATFVLSGIGIAFVTRLKPDLAVNQVLWLFLSIAAMVATLVIVRDLDKLASYKYTLGIAGIVLLIIPMIFGTEISGSKLWIQIGSFSFQPGEIAKVLVILFLASYLSENRELLSASTRSVGPIALPKPRMVTPVLTMWGISLLIVIFERDLGSALLFFPFHSVDKLLFFHLISKNIQKIDHDHVLVHRFFEGIFHPFVGLAAYINEDVAGRNLHNIVRRGLITVKVHTAVQQHGHFSISGIFAQNILYPIIDREDGRDDLQLVSISFALGAGLLRPGD